MFWRGRRRARTRGQRPRASRRFIRSGASGVFLNGILLPCLHIVTVLGLVGGTRGVRIRELLVCHCCANKSFVPTLARLDAGAPYDWAEQGFVPLAAVAVVRSPWFLRRRVVLRGSTAAARAGEIDARRERQPARRPKSSH